MRVIFFGTPAFAAPTLAALVRSQHDVAAVVTQPDRARGRGQKVTHSPVKSLALEHHVRVLQPDTLKTADALDEIRGIGADIGVVAAYGKILPQALLDIPARGMINVHASLLPRWRGAAPIHRAIEAGDTETGVTIMRVVFALDAGPMLSRVVVPIGPDVTSPVLESQLAESGARLLVETLDRLEAGSVEEIPQDDSRVTYAKKIERADGVIDWSRSAKQIHDQIRSMQPWPMAATEFRGQRLIVRASRISTTARSTATPGTVVSVTRAAVTVSTGDGNLDLVELQPESRKPQTAREFASGARLAVGEPLA